MKSMECLLFQVARKIFTDWCQRHAFGRTRQDYTKRSPKRWGAVLTEPQSVKKAVFTTWKG